MAIRRDRVSHVSLLRSAPMGKLRNDIAGSAGGLPSGNDSSSSNSSSRDEAIIIIMIVVVVVVLLVVLVVLDR